ncbi:uncharacterized protein O3C94_002034, partial [Discoglossus pictus]
MVERSVLKAGGVLFNDDDDESSSTTPGTDEESLEAETPEIEFDFLYHSSAHEGRTNEEITGLNAATAENKQPSCQEYFPHSSSSLVNKLKQGQNIHQQTDNALENIGEKQKILRLSHSGSDATYRSPKLNILDYSSKSLDWWNTEEQVEEVLDRNVPRHKEADQNNRETMKTAGSELNDKVPLKKEAPTPTYCYYDQVFSTVENALNNITDHTLPQMAKPSYTVDSHEVVDQCLHETESCEQKQIDLANTAEHLSTNTVFQHYSPNNTQEAIETKNCGPLSVHDQTCKQENVEDCKIHSDSTITSLGENMLYLPDSPVADPSYTESIPDILDSTIHEGSHFHSVDPDLWNTTDQASTETTQSGRDNNISQNSNNPDLCREYEADLAYDHDLFTQTNTVPKGKYPIENGELSQNTVEVKHEETLNPNVYLHKANRCELSDIYIEKLNEFEVEQHGMNTLTHSYISSLSTEDNSQTSINSVDAGGAMYHSKPFWELDSNDHQKYNTTLLCNTDELDLSFKENEDTNMMQNICLKQSISSIPMEITGKDDCSLQPELDIEDVLEHGSYLQYNQSNEEWCAQNIPVQASDTSAEFAKEEVTVGQLILEPGYQTINVGQTVEADWSDPLSPAGGDIGTVKESIVINNVDCSNDIVHDASIDLTDMKRDDQQMENEDQDNRTDDEIVNTRSETGCYSEVASGTKVNSFPLTGTNALSKQTDSDKVFSLIAPDTFQSISMTNGCEKQAAHEPECHSLQFEERGPSIIPQRLHSEKKSEELSEQEHSWSIILSQNDTSDTSPEEIFSRAETVDLEKDLGDSLYQGYNTQVRDNEYADLEE